MLISGTPEFDANSFDASTKLTAIPLGYAVVVLISKEISFLECI
jgi:hypothetical protein